MENVQVFYTQAEPLVKAINDFVERYGLATIASADHFCYKCGLREIFEQTRALLEPESMFVYPIIHFRTGERGTGGGGEPSVISPEIVA